MGNILLSLFKNFRLLNSLPLNLHSQTFLMKRVLLLLFLVYAIVSEQEYLKENNLPEYDMD